MVRKPYVIEKASVQSTLVPPGLPEVFRRIYYSLYSNSNIPRAERLGAEMTRLLFCKIYDETYNKTAEFRILPDESTEHLAQKIKRLFKNVKERFPDAFDKADKLYLDDKSISYVVLQLQNFNLAGSSRDVISESFQAFLGPGLRGEKGQFFTPRNVVKMCVEILNPKTGERIIDPACGSGGFLVECISQLGRKLYESDVEKEEFSTIFGIDKEVDLSRICKAYMSIIGDGHSNIFCADSLATESWSEDMKDKIRDESFDIVLTNPPFGARIAISDRNTLGKFELGHRWEKTESGQWKATHRLLSNQAPQVLFLERCLQLLKPGGRLAIVLPDGVFGNPSDTCIAQYVFQEAKVIAVVSLAPEAFLPGTHTKTSVLFLEKREKSNVHAADYDIFMGICNRVGHDKNGNVTYRMNEKGQYIVDENGNGIIDDDLPEVAKRFRLFLESQLGDYNHLGFAVKRSETKDSILIPSYYDPEIQPRLRELADHQKCSLATIGELVKSGVLSIKRGHEVGSRYYGMGDVPFVRTSDIVNWEIKIDPVKCIPEEIYNKYRSRQDIRENDVLLITDGTFLIGRTAIVTRLDTKIVIQSHIRRVRCMKAKTLHPYLLLYLLNTDIVQRQIRSKTFVQATISTVGSRLYETVLPIPEDRQFVERIIEEVSRIIELKTAARRKINEILHDSGNSFVGAQ
jgi:type I restriction enzyme M protein